MDDIEHQENILAGREVVREIYGKVAGLAEAYGYLASIGPSARAGRWVW